MASNESDGADEPNAILLPTILPLSTDEVKERLASLLELQGVSIDSFEGKVRLQGLTLQSVGSRDSSTTHLSLHSPPTTSTSTSTEGSPPHHATVTGEPDGSDSDSVAKIPTGFPKQEPGFAAHADVDWVASMAGLMIGEEAPKSMGFCPWRMVQNYPDWFVGKANTPRARPFFDQFHAHQKWDFYYFYSPNTRYMGPFLFVPVEQFTEFLGIINSHLDTNLAIPDAHVDRFSYRFGDEGTPRPKYLGRVHDADSSTRLLGGKSWPDRGEDAMKYGQVTSSARDKVRQTLDNIAKYTGGTKRKKSSAIKQALNREKRKRMMDSLQDALGLRPWETVSAASAGLAFAIDKAPAFPTEHAPVLITIDVEVNEFAHDMVTEVGFSILDTEKTKDVPPGELGEAWWPFVESKHLRIKEYSFHCNHRFIKGCPGKFNFGKSDFVPEKHLFKTIDDIFSQYATRTSHSGEKIERDIVLVGHDVGSDDKYLATVGYNLAAKNIILRADSKDLHQHLKSADQGRGLTTVLADFGIDSKNLHNAGNDAVYTLRAAIACVIEDMKEQVKPKDTPKENPKDAKDAGNVSDGSGYEEKQDVTWVPGKTYYYADDTDDDNLPMVL